MKSCHKFLLLGGVLLLWASLGGVCASKEIAKEKAKGKPEIPAGYEDAAAPKKEEADAKKKKSEAPVGYEDAAPAVKRKRKPHRRVVVPAMRNAKALANNAQLKAFAVQMRQQLKPYFAAELTFAKHVCQPSPKQLQEMKDLATPALEKTIQALAIQQAGQMGIGGRAFLGQRQQQQVNVLDQFEAAADQIVSQVFSAEIVQVYQEEQKQRAEFRARAGAMALVAHLDTTYRLSPAQREALTNSFQKVWQRNWQRYLQIMSNNPQFFPPVPDEAIVPHLNDIQAKQWNSRQRQSLGFSWQNSLNYGLFRNLRQENDWFKNPVENAAGNDAGVLQFFAPAVADVVEAAEEIAEEAVEEAKKE